jgi:hypothetical protein
MTLGKQKSWNGIIFGKVLMKIIIAKIGLMVRS